jgi:crossover junction endodeoxyribonuclease RuvC
MKYFLGVDPGKSGALALLDENGNPVEVLDYPGDDIKLARMIDELILLMQKPEYSNSLERKVSILCPPIEIKAAIEDVNSFQMGRQSAFNFGKNVGQWQGVLAANNIPYEFVRPQVWQKGQLRLQDGWTFREKKNRKTKQIERVKAIDTKIASLVGARRKYPSIELHLKKHHGRADALLIAEWLRLKYVLNRNIL